MRAGQKNASRNGKDKCRSLIPEKWLNGAVGDKNVFFFKKRLDFCFVLGLR